jgi:hypothetical protein
MSRDGRNYLVWHAARNFIVFEEFDHIGLGGDETRHQRADLFAIGLALERGGDQRLSLLRFRSDLGEVIALHTGWRGGLRLVIGNSAVASNQDQHRSYEKLAHMA